MKHHKTLVVFLMCNFFLIAPASSLENTTSQYTFAWPFEDQTKINEQSIENIHILKTGRLIECSVMLGQIGNEDLEEKELMKSFGNKIGLAFQITDDILEVTSSKETLGKNINSDVKNCKATYVNILGLDESIKKSKDLCESAINELKSIKSSEIDLLIELAKYICYREK